MGLDSVELVLEFESYFEIKISDAEAVEIGTVKEAVDCISHHIAFTDRNFDLKKNILNLITDALSQRIVIKTPLSFDQRIFEIIPAENKDIWKEVSKNIPFELPILSSKLDISSTTVDRFIDLVVAVNYKEMLIQGQMQNQHEVLLGVMGITIDKCGLYPYEVFPDKHFVKDFGIN